MWRTAPWPVAAPVAASPVHDDPDPPCDLVDVAVDLNAARGKGLLRDARRRNPLPRPSLSPESKLAAFRMGSALTSVLPGAVSRSMAGGIGLMAARMSGPGGMVALRNRRHLARHHLRRVYGPQMSEVTLGLRVDEAFGSYARYWAESLRLPSLAAEEVDAGMSFRGMDHLHNALVQGRGAILALPHLGGWDWGGMWMAQSDWPISVVVETLRPPEVFEWFVEFRRRLGMEVIPLDRAVAAASMRALRAGRALCLLSDRLVGATPGVDVELFGAPTRLPAGPVTLALRTGAPLLPCAVYFADGVSGHLAVVERPMVLERRGHLRDDVVRGTQQLAEQLELLIGRAPTQWHMMQPIWPEDHL
ncbi:MAG: phosphatidylinositol mannoside acyltransferase [Actinomycetota bacterium]|nr:phosphatidylinositol mannoside acyltransferase [Actinomycetota bacterium]